VAYYVLMCAFSVSRSAAVYTVGRPTCRYL